MPRNRSSLPPVDVYFPLIVRDWLTGGATFTMSNRERGAFMQLLAHSWLQDPPCTLPNDDAALAKYADEAPADWLHVREKMLAQFPVVADEQDPAFGRRRNPKLWEIHQDAVQRRITAQTNGKLAAEARWGAQRGSPPDDPATSPRRSGGGSTIAPARQPSKSFAEVVSPYPAVTGWVAASPDSREPLLRRMMNRVAEEVGREAVSGFVAVVNSALVGLNLDQRTPEEVELAVGDWCDTGKLTKHSLRNYMTGARAPKGGGLSPRTPRTDVAIAKAGQLLAGIKNLAREVNVPAQGMQRSIAKDAVVSTYGLDVWRAVEAIGGPQRILTAKPDAWGFITRDFAAQLAGATP